MTELQAMKARFGGKLPRKKQSPVADTVTVPQPTVPPKTPTVFTFGDEDVASDHTGKHDSDDDDDDVITSKTAVLSKYRAVLQQFGQVGSETS